MDFRRLVSIGAIYEISEIKKRWQGGVFRERERESDKFLLVLLCEKKKLCAASNHMVADCHSHQPMGLLTACVHM